MGNNSAKEIVYRTIEVLPGYKVVDQLKAAFVKLADGFPVSSNDLKIVERIIEEKIVTTSFKEGSAFDLTTGLDADKAVLEEYADMHSESLEVLGLPNVNLFKRKILQSKNVESNKHVFEEIDFEEHNFIMARGFIFIERNVYNQITVAYCVSRVAMKIEKGFPQLTTKEIELIKHQYLLNLTFIQLKKQGMIEKITYTQE